MKNVLNRELKMKNNWFHRKLKEILVIVFIIFALLFYKAGQFWPSFFTLGLVIIIFRIADLKTFVVGSKGIAVEFGKKNEKLLKVIKSNKSSKEKVQESQKLIDEIFKLGWQAGGGRSFANILNVKIIRDENGIVKYIQYDEN